MNIIKIGIAQSVTDYKIRRGFFARNSISSYEHMQMSGTYTDKLNEFTITHISVYNNNDTQFKHRFFQAVESYHDKLRYVA